MTEFHLEDKVIVHKIDIDNDKLEDIPWYADKVFATDNTGIVLKISDGKWNLDGTLQFNATYPKYYFVLAESEKQYRELLILNISKTFWQDKPTWMLEDIHSYVINGSGGGL